METEYKTLNDGLWKLSQEYQKLGWDVECVLTKVLVFTEEKAYVGEGLNALERNIVFSLKHAPPNVDTAPLIGLQRMIKDIIKVYNRADPFNSERSKILDLAHASRESFDMEQLQRERTYSYTSDVDTAEMDAELAEAFADEPIGDVPPSEWKPEPYTPSKWYQKMVLEKSAPEPIQPLHKEVMEMKDPYIPLDQDTVAPIPPTTETPIEDRKIEPCPSPSSIVEASSLHMTTSLSSVESETQSSIEQSSQEAA